MSIPPPARPTVDFTVRQAFVMDESGDFGPPTDLQVTGGRIAAIGPDLPRNSLDVDLSGCWLMPGVVDAHLHAVTHSFDGWEQLNTPYSYRITETLDALRRTLAAGVTFVRDAGGLDAGVRDAVAAGLSEAPELQVSVVPLSRTGGHGDGFLAGVGRPYPVDGMLPDYPGRPPHVADGVDEVRRVVRTILRSGADWIKIMATGGVMSAGAGEFPAEFTGEELTTAIVEADRRGKPAMVHALGGPAIGQALRAGARSIEHGLWLTEADADLMASTGATLVPTLGIYAHLAELAATPGALPAATADRARAAGVALGDAVRIARAAGVPIALGTDFAHRDHHGHNLTEIAHLVAAGLTVAEALVAATSAGADLCGVGHLTGRLRVGYRFDAVVLDADPSDPETFRSPESVGGVFAAGRPVRPHPRWPMSRC
ncbi:Imidazolonepropionase [Nakamurella panacisegetis]|uniref:Imidazolonepropionase n=1 Tax=Nakamurella panacisegetis TaxID=1090615 RepID=A0A1H0SSS4_9ACTN|nr:amidohydrolase family protein [Nakamurella panacisegetis]SDP44763.1 Imidazolonepropionase [Nakamurella panacisegetis]